MAVMTSCHRLTLDLTQESPGGRMLRIDQNVVGRAGFEDEAPIHEEDTIGDLAGAGLFVRHGRS
jgi:hypothetical protein